MQISQLFIHPIKSCAALARDELLIEPRGAVDDRRWMLVDEAGRFVTGRQLGALVRLQVEPIAGGLRLRFAGDSAEVAQPDHNAARRSVQIWKDSVEAASADAAANAWLSQRLGRTLQLVFMDERAVRPVAQSYAQVGDEVSFADGFPLLVISQAALDDLSARVGRRMDSRRFRPNLLLAGAAAHAEDSWRRVRIDGIEFDAVKPCTRCVFTTVDPDSGERAADGEPLASLKSYRRSGDGVTFGMNLIPRGSGPIRRGAEVEVLDSA